MQYKIPKGYPNKLTNLEVENVIENALDCAIENAGVPKIVNRDVAFINLGLMELQRRKNDKDVQKMFWISIGSLILVLVSFLIDILICRDLI